MNWKENDLAEEGMRMLLVMMTIGTNPRYTSALADDVIIWL